ncbi:MAG: hypothetical protein V4773_10770, partial [Verrucomicrobiota bacterium]
MSRPRSVQEFIHWLEVGSGGRWIVLFAFLVSAVLLSLRVANQQFHGPTSEMTLVQADMGRQLARGAGFTTQVNFPQASAVLAGRGVRFDPKQPYPELYHAPLYSLAIAGGLRVLPEGKREALFSRPEAMLDAFRGDYFLLALNLLLLWLALWLTYDLGRRLFEPRVGWVAMLAMLLSVPIWQQVVAVNGTPLLMVLGLAAFWCWLRVEGGRDEPAGEQSAEGSTTRGLPWRWLGALGVVCGLLFLTEYSAGALVLVALGYAVVRFEGSARWGALASVLVGFALVTAPWVVRNIGGDASVMSSNIMAGMPVPPDAMTQFHRYMSSSETAFAAL